jgi:predicted 3-demethylubiquinone-9 3-methyltransferase (glyoxalase superfamily)
MKKVTPFLSFDGQAEEAARFYVSLLPDSRIDRVTRSPLDTPGGVAGTANGGSEIACGWLKDRWGVFWQVTPTRLMELIKDPDPNRARRAMEAMVKMIKIDIAEVERAAGGA